MKIIFYLVLVSLVSLTTLPLNGYCDDWVYVYSDKDFTQYYKSSSVKIDKQKKIIKVWVKYVYTFKGKKDLLNEIESIQVHRKLIDISYSLSLWLLDYKESKLSIAQRSHYSKTGDLLSMDDKSTEWINIIPDSKGDFIFNQILKDYNIQR